MSIHQRLSDVAEIEFSNIVDVVEDFKNKLRIHLKDGSFILELFPKPLRPRISPLLLQYTTIKLMLTLP